MFWFSNVKAVLATTAVFGATILATALGSSDGGAPAQAPNPMPDAPAGRAIVAGANPVLSTVRIRVSSDGPDGGARSSLGTIVSSTSDETFILTSAHNLLSKGSEGKPQRIEVLYPDPSSAGVGPSADGHLEIGGDLIASEEDRDLAVLRIRPGRVLPSVRLARSERRLEEGRELLRTERTSDDTTVLRYTTVVETNATLINSGKNAYRATVCLGLVMPGDSGSALFLRSGPPNQPSWEVVGVCNAAIPEVSKGYYASPESIRGFLDANGLSRLYLTPGAGSIARPDADARRRKADAGAVAIEDQEPLPPAPSPASPSPPTSSIVRLMVQYPSSRAHVLGTIIHSDSEQSIIVTCANVFDEVGPNGIRKPRFDGHVTVSLSKPIASPFGSVGYRPGPPPVLESHPGELIDYDVDRGVGVIRIRPGRKLPRSRLAPREWRPEPGSDVIMVDRFLAGTPLTEPTSILEADVVRPYPPGRRGWLTVATPTRFEAGTLGSGLFTKPDSPESRIGDLVGLEEFSRPKRGATHYASARVIHEILDKHNLSALVREPVDEPVTPLDRRGDEMPLPVMLAFHADWCGACKRMHPIESRLRDRGYPVRSIDIDRSPDETSRYHVQSIPTYVVVDDAGRELDRVSGAQSAAELARFYLNARQKMGSIAVQTVGAASPIPDRLEKVERRVDEMMRKLELLLERAQKAPDAN